MAEILEATENLKKEAIHTVRSKRGEEILINVDKLVMAWVDFMSDKNNEERNGWNLEAPWFEDALKTVVSASLVQRDP